MCRPATTNIIGLKDVIDWLHWGSAPGCQDIQQTSAFRWSLQPAHRIYLVFWYSTIAMILWWIPQVSENFFKLCIAVARSRGFVPAPFSVVAVVILRKLIFIARTQTRPRPWSFKRKFAKISQSWKRPLQGPSHSFKCLLALSHLRHYQDTMLNRC